MSAPENVQVRLKERPSGIPDDATWEVVGEPAPAPGEGEVLLRTVYVSVDPAMRGWIRDRRSYLPPVEIGAVMRALTLSQVAESRHPGFAAGEYVSGTQGVQLYSVSDGKGLYQVDPKLAPLPRYLSALGMTGMTAYFGLLDVGKPKQGETVLVSGAAGAVGSVVGQIAKIKGCRAVGIAGGADKCRYLTGELGFDAAIDYRAGDLKKNIRAHCPQGVDVYFDNVGGETLDAALTAINRGARIPICGAISQYNEADEAIRGPANYLSLLVNRARMEGFLVMDYAASYGKAADEMAQWLAEGKLKSKEHIVEGIERFPEALNMLFTGENFGKLIVKVADE